MCCSTSSRRSLPLNDTHELKQDPSRTTPETSQTVAVHSRRAFLGAAAVGTAGLATPSLMPERATEPQAKQESGNTDLAGCLSATSELAQFMRDAETKLRGMKLSAGQELEPALEKAGVKIPNFLRGSGITHETHSEEFAKAGPNNLVIVTAGDPTVVDIRVFCICSKRWRICVCLECGWIWCRIVIRGTF